MCLLDDHLIEMTTTMGMAYGVCLLSHLAPSGLLAVVGEVMLITLLGQGIGLRVLLPYWGKEEKES